MRVTIGWLGASLPLAMNVEEQINQHIESVLRTLKRHNGRMLHSPLLYKCQYSMNAKVLRIVLERMKAKGLIVEQWDHEEHSYTVQGGDKDGTSS